MVLICLCRIFRIFISWLFVLSENDPSHCELAPIWVYLTLVVDWTYQYVGWIDVCIHDWVAFIRYILIFMLKCSISFLYFAMNFQDCLNEHHYCVFWSFNKCVTFVEHQHGISHKLFLSHFSEYILQKLLEENSFQIAFSSCVFSTALIVSPITIIEPTLYIFRLKFFADRGVHFGLACPFNFCWRS